MSRIQSQYTYQKVTELLSRVDELEQGSGGAGLPAGGLTGEVLTKQSSADGDADWYDPEEYEVQIQPDAPTPRRIGDVWMDDDAEAVSDVADKFFYVDYNDTSTSSTPLTLLPDTWTTLPNDGLGSFTNETQLPPGETTLLGTGGYIDISNLAIGSDILVRPDFTITPLSNNSALAFRFSLGTGANAYTLESSLGRLDLGAGIPYRRALQALYIYAGDSNTVENPIYLQVKLSGGGTVTNAGMAIKVYSK